MKYKILSIMLALATSVGALTSCSTGDVSSSAGSENSGSSVSSSEVTDEETGITTTSAVSQDATYPSYFSADDQFTDRDLSANYADTKTKITLSGDSVSVDGSGVSVDGTNITITKEGTYIFTGTLNDGQIVVSAADTEKVQIVLNGASITNDDSACILVLSADKVFVTALKGTENSLSDTGAAYTQTTSDYTVDGVIFSKEDLVLNGEGTLNINAGYKHGVVGKDDVKLAGLTLNIEAAGKGVTANDSIRVASGTYNITSVDDALHTSESSKEGKGYIYILDGEFNLASGDDGIHAETGLIIDGGNIDVSKSYEGLEGHTIDINGGTINIVASDDGLNAAGGSSDETAGSSTDAQIDWHNGTEYFGTLEDTTEGTSFGGMGGMGGMMMDSDSEAYIIINGGTITVDAGGDGIDSNGTLTVNGGTVYVNGPTNNGNGALDCGLGATINGGTVIAVGSSGMAETFGNDSVQYSILYNFSSQIAAGTKLTLTDSNGNVAAEYTPTKNYQSAVISTADISNGTYTISAGNESASIEVTSISTSNGQGGMMMGGPGGHMPQGGLGDNGFKGEHRRG